MFGEWLDVVSLLELSVCHHYIWTSFISVFFIYVEFHITAKMVTEFWEMVQLYLFFQCCCKSEFIYSWFLCNRDKTFAGQKFCLFPLYDYRSLLLIHLYKCLSNIDTCIYQKAYKCKNCLHKNLPLATVVCSLRIHFIGKKYICMYKCLFVFDFFLEDFFLIWKQIFCLWKADSLIICMSSFVCVL